jgi:hypothetical protein
MGSNFATDLADEDLFPNLDLETAIGYHLRGNHYPPVPLSMVQPCIDAIKACNDEMNNKLITLPEGVTWRGSVEAPAWAIVDAHHLDAWIQYYGWEEEDDTLE